MKKLKQISVCLFSIYAVTCMNINTANAQAFSKGSMSVDVGYGFGTLIGSISSLFTTYEDVTTSSLGPIYAKFEYAAAPHVGLGLNFAYASNSWKFGIDDYDANGKPVVYTETDKRTTYSIMARLNGHIGSGEKFDPYVGFGIGYRNASWTSVTNDPDGYAPLNLNVSIPIGFEFSVGARYLITPNIGLYAELGACKSVFQGGLVFNLPGE